ncbi:amidohydrolase family protein [Lophium mytilinum]|uniref:Amidohydrolase family protein n=1 Tax=Lophium mytilinum TaxID=390894 RepID=A0A6A6R9S2_9PEZI|nr:amidohydrolase family protein [Lophium mytilinum]
MAEMEKAQFLPGDHLPTYSDAVRPWTHRRRHRRAIRLLSGAILLYFVYSVFKIASNTAKKPQLLSLDRLQQDYTQCSALRRIPSDPSGPRDYNKRWVNGTKPILIRNATVWVGDPEDGTSQDDARAGKGWSWISADVFLDHGLIKQASSGIYVKDLPHDTEIFEAEGRQLTSGIVDMHSHAGLGSFANLDDDTNELSADITPYVRSIDGFNPLAPEVQWIKSGGVTTSLLLPGSGNNIGGQAYVVKLATGKSNGRTEISQADMLADPDSNWRYMKMACGENAKRVYGRFGKQGPTSRLGEAWEFRHAFEQAKAYVESQNDWCKAADTIGAENMDHYLSQDLKWEALGAVLRGQVRVNTHCYTVPDLEDFVRYTNEFKFRLYAFHHAHQTFLVPEVLKRTYGGTPAAALFADNMYYKVEAYTASEQAGKILYANGITPTYVSDNPVLNAQHVLFEAAKAYRFGLPYHAALSGVTSAPAELLGLGERVGKVKAGFDADIVVWDSDPLSVGAAPIQVWIDGAPQFSDPVLLEKPSSLPIEPEATLSVDRKLGHAANGNVIFTGVDTDRIFTERQAASLQGEHSTPGTVIITKGAVECAGSCIAELEIAKTSQKYQVIALQNGSISPAFIAFGSGLGLSEIDAEGDTHDGKPWNSWTRALDGLLFGGKQLAAAFEHGVTRAITAPSTGGIDARGVSVGFSTSAEHALAKGAIWADEIAVHYSLTLNSKTDKTPSISAVLAELRKKLLDATSTKENSSITAEHSTAKDANYEFTEEASLKKVVAGSLPLVITVHSADTVASILRLKADVESAMSESYPLSGTAPKIRLVIHGCAECHLVASSLADSSLAGIVLAPLLPYSQSWDQRRSLTGAPLTNLTNLEHLIDAGFPKGKLAIGAEETWQSREMGLLASWAYTNSEGRLTEKEALALVGDNLVEMLGLGDRGVDGPAQEDWLIWEGSPLAIDGRLKAIVHSGSVSVFQ